MADLISTKGLAPGIISPERQIKLAILKERHF